MTSASESALDTVLERSRSLRFIGPGSVRVHAEHARGFAAGLDGAPARFLDLGSGGGVPGLVLAGLWPDSEAVLLDASAKRCAFLVDAIDDLGYTGRVTVVRARAEDGGRREDLRATFDLVVSRGFGPPPVTAECGAPFLQVDGTIVVSEPPAPASPELPDASSRWPAAGLALLGLRGERAWSDPFHYRSFVLERPCPEEYPRRDGVPAKHPLF
jgi:16S rRNA (guanine527-N7)-methyltransferase